MQFIVFQPAGETLLPFLCALRIRRPGFIGIVISKRFLHTQQAVVTFRLTILRFFDQEQCEI